MSEPVDDDAAPSDTDGDGEAPEARAPDLAATREARSLTTALRRCPFCHTELAQRDAALVCQGCLAPHHAGCWRELRRCSSCGSERALAPAPPWERVQPPAPPPAREARAADPTATRDAGELTIVLRRCPFCHTELAQRDAALVCQGCLAPHHAECWRELRRCSSCGSERALAPAPPWQRVQPPAPPPASAAHGGPERGAALRVVGVAALGVLASVGLYGLARSGDAAPTRVSRTAPASPRRPTASPPGRRRSPRSARRHRPDRSRPRWFACR